MQVQADDPERFAALLAELAYLANILVAGADLDGRRLRPSEASEAALATVALGTELEARDLGAAPHQEVLRDCGADRLFRKARRWLAAHPTDASRDRFVRSWEMLAIVLR